MTYDKSLRQWGALEDIAHHPHWVYEIWKDGTCLYVGMTNNLERRLREHANQRGWKRPAVQVKATEYPDRCDAGFAEAARIRELRPTCNTRLNRRMSAPTILGPRTDPLRARTGNQPRFITAAEWHAKYGKAAS